MFRLLFSIDAGYLTYFLSDNRIAGVAVGVVLLFLLFGGARVFGNTVGDALDFSDFGGGDGGDGCGGDSGGGDGGGDGGD